MPMPLHSTPPHPPIIIPKNVTVIIQNLDFSLKLTLIRK
jgi:hypothetical protein